ncbi:putative quinone oxidoreductase [Heterostelium album PN500]|uniref:Probable quinone oxidoreductase n=1 Tax=Heterostelium pallidum (strain ATCC 26659 / Pp 5 / PN500) TaxID=670386 RepID=D3BKR3_HETP5|nr:putative quinone oxidoreductase [Heterostelium album PN500]EFA78493.1 putative quinone oxidoreductase [Heterostelium album PN500]|eukprot:XP_020430617.1 putative quinone oxidoreductase [Heterostelium album PN500]
MKAVRIHATGGPKQLVYEDIPVPTVKPNEVLVQNECIGVNFIDTYHRSGLYKLELPAILGREGSGKVVAVGEQATNLKIGDRVTYFSPNSYAQFTSVPQHNIYVLPDGIDYETAAAYTLQGLTAHYLVRSTFALKSGDTCLIQAGAGGLGQALIQMAKIIGAHVITTVSTPEKEQLVRNLGADYVINYRDVPEFSGKVRELTNGKGVDVVYDGVGASTWMQSLKSLRPLGYLCLVGNASGPVPPIDPLLLSANGSVFITRPTLADYIRQSGEMQSRCKEIFQWIADGKLKLSSKTSYPLERVSEAHEALEGRTSIGKNFITTTKIKKKKSIIIQLI